jgi:hypothetical protein
MKVHEALRDVSPNAALDRGVRALFRQRVRDPVFTAIGWFLYIDRVRE